MLIPPESQAAQDTLVQAQDNAKMSAIRSIIRAEGVRPALGHPSPRGGQVLHSHQPDQAAQGGGEQVILAPDGSLWLVVSNTKHTDWIMNDQSRGVGYRVPAGERARTLAGHLGHVVDEPERPASSGMAPG